MLNQLSQQQQEDYLNDFIDALIVECKPAPPTSLDHEFASMLETVRGVKRLRSEKELLADLDMGGQDMAAMKADAGEKTKPSWRKVWISGAAVAATLFLAFGIFSELNHMNPTTENAEEAPAMLRSAEVAEDSATPAETAPETASGDAAPEIAASEGPETMEAMEAPAAEEESISMFGLQEAMPNSGVAIVIKQIDTSYVELKLIDVPVHYQSFRLTEELKNTFNDNSFEQGALYTVSFDVEEGEMPVLTMMKPLEEAVLEARYLGRADNNFAEFLINGNVQVMALSDEAKSEAEALEADLDSLPEGVLARITIEGTNLSTNGIVTRIDKISD